MSVRQYRTETSVKGGERKKAKTINEKTIQNEKLACRYKTRYFVMNS